MKKVMLVGLVMGVYAMSAQAEDCFDMDIGFPCESEAVSTVEQSQKVADNAKNTNEKLRIKFISRRPYLSKQQKQDRYLANDEWVGATYQSDNAPGLETKRKSNINMFSRRPYRAGQPD